MCKSCGCGIKKEKKKYVCKKCGKVSDKKEICCGEEMKEVKE
jgi:hypothetical protein